MAKMTIYTLARELNMTPSMVSRAFNPNARISEEKRRLVLETAQRYQFSPNRHASRLSMKPIRLGILLCSRFQVNTDKMIDGIREAHEALRGYKIDYEITVLTPETPLDEVRGVLEGYRDCDGILLSGMSRSEYTEMIDDLYRGNPNIVQVQAINREARCLFSSEHNEARASGLASDFLYQCLRRGERKNVLLFTGDLRSTVHREASEAFRACCERLGMTLLDTVDMHDNEDYFESILPAVLEKYGKETDGIYITSGLSLPLCRALEVAGLTPPLVAFDTHDGIVDYMRRGVISAAISQNVKGQMKVAFSTLVSHLITDEPCPPILYTEVQLKLNTNIK